ncbi:MAG TPA: valine--tRNA ligase, partial [Coxiellaceae bacterium]|nr:MAG: valine--tRNA ligase [Gammaproteobacteria bacterium RBG_16_37_9]HBY56092.1 valine--tRNA ligase [Coxiellaceae bacterium]
MKNKTYEPHLIEQTWYQKWEQNNYFAPSGKGSPYCIVIPPPNITGTLHMGHGFQMTIMDILIRYHRMLGNNTMWQLGTDHAGIATQMVVENILHNEGKSRHDIGREDFVKKIWEWKKYSGDTIAKQERRLGISGDWTREKFTLDPELSQKVQHVFIKLYEEGLIYRGKRLVNWDPVLKTAISDLEVINEDQEGVLWYIKYPLLNSNESLTIATTRPETMLGDTAVAVNPNDKRYQHLIGKQIKLPLTDRIILIIADEYVDQEFGSGCVKITPAHDFNDYAIGQRHNLPLLNIFTQNAHLNENVPKPYQGLERFQARKQIIKDLESAGLLLKTEKHQLKIPKGDRSNAIIEPYLTDQWFVKTKELAKPAIEVVIQGKIKFIPNNWSKIYFQWLENIEDWCISRQLWWGHRIPAWFDEKNNIYVGTNEEDVRTKYKLGDITLKQDDDVLDTWFSSALWPFATLGWPEATKEFKTFYPTSVLVTGFDIIFFWVARMVMFGLKFTGEIPFKEVYITGLIRDSHGQKMSKSKGNILDPIDLVDGITLDKLIEKRTSNLMQKHLATEIEKQTRKDFPGGIPSFGVDALRFTFGALATTSRDINFDINRLEGYRNFCTKIWNATRYVLLQLENFDYTDNNIEYSLADRWIQTEIQNTLHTITTEFKTYRFDLITQAIYELTWYQFCDWYLELVKPILNSDQFSPALKQGARKTLVTTLENLLRIIHPFMPFITEELWQEIAPKLSIKEPSIMLQKYPEFDIQKIDHDAASEIQWLKKIILAIRNIRGEMNIPSAKPIALILHNGTESDHNRIKQHEYYLKALAKIESITWIKEEKISQATITFLIDTLEFHIVLANLIDLDSEIARINKEINKLKEETERARVKLNNSGYTAKAPQDIINKDRTRLLENQNILDKLQTQLEKLQQLKGSAG